MPIVKHFTVKCKSQNNINALVYKKTRGTIRDLNAFCKEVIGNIACTFTFLASSDKELSRDVLIFSLGLILANS